MKGILLTPIFKCFKKKCFFSSLNQNTRPVYDAEETKEQQGAIRKLYQKKGDSFAPVKKQDNPHHPAFFKILALHIVFVSNKNLLLVEWFVSN